MVTYRRDRTTGGTWFFTVVTYEGCKILTNLEFREALRNAITDVRQNYPFKIDAWVLLPDHLHCIWTLPDGDNGFSKRWGLIKAGVTKQIGSDLMGGAHPTLSRIRKRESTLWQRRFWEHRIRDEKDMINHADYIHYNPVKHGLIESPVEWEFSSFHRYVKEGVYDKGWGSNEALLFDSHIGKE